MASIDEVRRPIQTRCLSPASRLRCRLYTSTLKIVAAYYDLKTGAVTLL